MTVSSESPLASSVSSGASAIYTICPPTTFNLARNSAVPGNGLAEQVSNKCHDLHKTIHSVKCQQSRAVRELHADPGRTRRSNDPAATVAAAATAATAVAAVATVVAAVAAVAAITREGKVPVFFPSQTVSHLRLSETL